MMEILRTFSEEEIFLNNLRQPGLRKSLQEMAKGHFQDQKHPLDYAYGITVDAGLTRCTCGLWGSVDTLIKDGVPIPCPHLPRPKYGKCPECNAEAVHLAMHNALSFYGDSDDDNGDPSCYDEIEQQSDVCVAAHICFSCGHLVDVFIEKQDHCTWFGAVVNSEAICNCDNCGDSPHVEIDCSLRCVCCGADNGCAQRITDEAKRVYGEDYE